MSIRVILVRALRSTSVTVDEPLDGRELQLARWASEREVATLGICRGQQLPNVALAAR
jgi:gamma-glutamyl-gamma-aminobutyrate hydrolase PuuD